MKNKYLLGCILIFVSLLITGCTGSQKNCPPSELEDYLIQSNLTIEAFQGLLGQGTNHPEQKSEVAEKMRTLKNELELSTPPKCATKYQTLVSEAMQSSLTFFNTVKDRYYEPAELAQFAYENWKKAAREEDRLVQKYISP